VLPEKRTNTNVGVGTGFLLQLGGLFLAQTEGTAAILGLVLILFSIPLFLWGCMNYAEGKGYSTWVGLVGFAGIIGLIVLIVLPDQDHGGSVGTSVRVAFVMSMIVGLVLVAYGVQEDRRHYFRASQGPVPLVCMSVGTFLAVGSLLFLLRTGRR
jgi:hypothetical protein